MQSPPGIIHSYLQFNCWCIDTEIYINNINFLQSLLDKTNQVFETNRPVCLHVVIDKFLIQNQTMLSGGRLDWQGQCNSKQWCNEPDQALTCLFFYQNIERY